MKCLLCAGRKSDGITTFTADINNICTIVIKNVPSNVCNQCGEPTYTSEVIKQIEQIVDLYRSSNLEVALVYYEKSLAQVS